MKCNTCIKRPFDLSQIFVILSRPKSNKNVSMKSLDFSSHFVMMSPFTSFMTRFPLSFSSSILFWNRNFFSFKKLTFRSFAVQPRAKFRRTYRSQSFTIRATMSEVETPRKCIHNHDEFVMLLFCYQSNRSFSVNIHTYLRYDPLQRTFHAL